MTKPSRTYSDENHYSACWDSPSDPRTECGVTAGVDGVDFWEKSGPSPNDGYGWNYTWARWFEVGKAPAGGPADMLSRIDELGRKLGHHPKKPARAVQQREDLADSAEARQAEHTRYVAELRRQAQHSSPETLRISRGDLQRLRKLALQRAVCLWTLLRPGVVVKGSNEAVSVAGTHTTRSTDYLAPDATLAYRLVQVEDLFRGEDGEFLWFTLRVQCALDEGQQFGIWFIEGECQIEVILHNEAAVDHYVAALRKEYPKLAADQRLCGAVRAFYRSANGSSGMYSKWFGRTAPTRLPEQEGDRLWPALTPASKPVATAADELLPKFRPWPSSVRKLLCFGLEADEALHRRAIESGLHWVLPIGTTTYGCWLGLRRLPNTEPAQWPVLLCHGPNASTIASELRDSLAILVWWLGPRFDEGQELVLRKNWPVVEDHLLACAEGIGGANAVMRVGSWLHGERASGMDQPTNTPEFLSACASLISQLDPPQQAFREQIAGMPGGAAPRPEQVPKAWREALAATWYSALPSDPLRAWPVACGLPSLDTGGRLGISHFVNVKYGWSTAALAAKVALRMERSGPLARPLAAMVQAQAAGRPYDGMAHVEAAARASVEGDHETAWNLLAAAGFWSAQARGKTDPVILEAAQTVAVQAGYGDCFQTG